jgi:AcrR family transcriptional regulator
MAASERPRGAGAAKPKRKTYHHGNLRQALLDAALQILETEDVAALTLREAARRAGVSQAAPYRHFADKDALLAAVAEQGFRALTAAMRAAGSPLGDDVLSRFRSLGMTYVQFARQHPARFRLMFGRDLPARTAHPGLEAAGAENFGLLLEGIAAGQAAGLIRAGDPHTYALAAWATVHGLAALQVDGRLPGEEAAEAQRTAAVLTCLYLGLRPEPRAP